MLPQLLLTASLTAAASAVAAAAAALSAAAVALRLWFGWRSGPLAAISTLCNVFVPRQIAFLVQLCSSQVIEPLLGWLPFAYINILAFNAEALHYLYK